MSETTGAEPELVSRARQGDEAAFEALLAPLRQPLFSYVYRLVTHRQDAEDLVQDVMLRAATGLPKFKAESAFKTWLFGIATHVCLDHLRQKQRWRVEAQLDAERAAEAHPEAGMRLMAVMSQPDFIFEIREHVAFCFSCVSRSLPPEEQAALMLREVLGFSNQEAADILNLSEPVFRHRLSSARATMIRSYEGLCQLINKTGACYQCRGLREIAPEANRGPDLVQIEVVPGQALTPENLFDARLALVRDAEFGHSRMRPMHDWFFEAIGAGEEKRGGAE
jgi:RNA polymerase sigma-70 factor, ECF subfamily